MVYIWKETLNNKQFEIINNVKVVTITFLGEEVVAVISYSNKKIIKEKV